MKKLLIIFLATGVLMSCDSKKKTKDESKTDKTTETTTTDTKTEDNTTTTVDNTTTTDSEWKTADETRFMTDCESTAKDKVGAVRANEYCDCMLQKIKARYKSYQDADRELGKNEADMNKLANECNTQ